MFVAHKLIHQFSWGSSKRMSSILNLMWSQSQGHAFCLTPHATTAPAISKYVFAIHGAL